jgi:DNA-directed RNA polymerase specialized sigma24 family protein
LKLLDLSGTVRVDPLLLPFLQASDEKAEAALSDLLTQQARPVVQAILRRDARQDGPDLEGEVLLCLIERLRRLRRDPGEEGIRDFRGYVAVVTYNVASRQARLGRRESSGARKDDGDPLLLLPDPAPDAALAFERRTYLARLWGEIRQLPPRQAAALLLNLRDGHGGNAAALLPLTGIATLREMATAVGLPSERLAGLWNGLPMEDATLADLLGVTRQQVINLRKSARERLARRMRGH